MVSNAAQRTLGWYRVRLGNITGSMVGVLMKPGRNGDFSDTGKSYLYQLAAEREMNPAIVGDDETFEVYLRQVDTSTKAMRFGSEQEAAARDLYEKLTGNHAVEVGSCRHPSIPHFASSPDGFVYNEFSGTKICLEIKVPNQATYMKYRSEVGDNESLLRAKPEYFYQCMAHMMVTGAGETHFIAYNPFQRDPIHIVPIMADNKVFVEMERRIRLADEFINRMVLQ